MRLSNSTLLAASALGATGCIFFHMQRDPNAARIFPPTLSQMQSGIRMSESNVDGTDSDFQGALAGVTDKVTAEPEYKSMMGKYTSAKKRYEGDKSKWTDLSAWAESVKSDPVQADVDRLRSEGMAIQQDMNNVAVTLRLLPADLTRIQNAQQWKRVSTR